MPPEPCECDRPHVFADDPRTCCRCGRPVRPSGATGSTWRLAVALAEIANGHRVGDRNARPDRQGGGRGGKAGIPRPKK